ncbi:hypothetical protein SDRG_07659 [Saprolegnia diclina VS20]|uniref:Uncharacterized protein n=1 Tax=Saprolegnia diclina (strain VS20) TaxID=1156394 RepID=T0RWV6_SAPDV|nr:hypothetical protein SDRG_07659 [Saprolegnia diclina VS20]EQC34857.1 hypothetical protein SDRG_07659 [Saprolegnia diclina VS20]|eukprot:XP_008611729.1 hypothetical protein SDRG_07659 [Saprolegnia diclina VS20]
MSLAVRTPALTALLGLLTLPRGGKHWPQAYLNSTTVADIGCICTAITVFNNVCIDGVCCNMQWPASHDPAFCPPYRKFVLCRMLVRCTNLLRACIPAESGLVEAVTSPAHCAGHGQQ